MNKSVALIAILVGIAIPLEVTAEESTKAGSPGTPIILPTHPSKGPSSRDTSVTPGPMSSDGIRSASRFSS